MVSMTLNSLFERTVFLFGAGASMDAGCLSSKAMLADLKKSIYSLPVEDPCRDQFAAIYNFIIQSLTYQHALKDPDTKLSDLSNIEDFVAVLRQMIDREYVVPSPLIGNWNSKITNWELKNEKVFRQFLDFSYNCLLEKWTMFSSEKASELMKPFIDLTRSDENFDLSVFSLNYDLIFENVFNSSEENLVELGFSQKRWSGDFNDPNGTAKIKLYKLHGSADWHFDEADEDVKQGVVEGIRPLIVFGSGPKIQSYDPFLSLLGSFRQKLKAANLFVVVGYSFQDKYINNILIQSLSSGLNKKMLIVDPGCPAEKMTFINRVEKFQQLRSMNEIMSLTKISPDRVDIVCKTAAQFFVEYLSNSAEKLKEALANVERGDTVF